MAIESLPPLRLRRRDASERTSLGRRLLWCGVALLAVGVTVISQYPAAWAAERVASATGQRVLLADPQGSIWHGSATLALTAGNGGADATVLPGRLSWSVDMLPLLTGTLRAHVAHDRALEQPVALTVTPSNWQAEAGAIKLPASLLEGIGAPFNTLKLDGRLRAQWTPLSGQFGRGKGQPDTVQGALTVTVEQVSSSLSRVRPLGSYQAVLSFGGAGGGPMQLALSTLAGPLSLQGQGTLGQGAHFDGVASATPESEPQLIGLLSLLGPRDGSHYRLRF
ncbi:general secretion pathway protein GspN [Ralstonia sp. A12]|uniref:type II secretion system protein N n=1 Tax=Ralstonia sp. A12 TaxID=1217052 RepID=UPI0005741FA2|nr:type II secretion system protein N [Ralstonia sp. A12]KHK51886.1 general secretion pathway protein GspN [Ralstonia sp. A12]